MKNTTGFYPGRHRSALTSGMRVTQSTSAVSPSDRIAGSAARMGDSHGPQRVGCPVGQPS